MGTDGRFELRPSGTLYEQHAAISFERLARAGNPSRLPRTRFEKSMFDQAFALLVSDDRVA
jgi:hypothetical protein